MSTMFEIDLQARLESLRMTYPECGIVSTEPASKWDFGTCVGNGIQGALAIGRTNHETFVLSHERMFLPLYPFPGYIPVKEHYETIRQLVIDRKTYEAQRLIHKIKVDGGFPLYNTTDPFVGAAAMDMQMGGELLPEAYLRSVDFEHGDARVAWRDGGGVVHRDFFVSRADDVLVVRLWRPGGGVVDVDVKLREIEYEQSPDPRDHNIYEKTIDHCETTAQPGMLTHRMVFKRNWASQPLFGSATLARLKQQGGSVTAGDERVCISGAKEVLLLVRTVPHFNGEPLDLQRIADRLSELDADYDQLRERHVAIHSEKFNRCRLKLEATPAKHRSGEQMFMDSKVGDTDPALVERTFHAARYSIISSTGDLPPALQGVWTGTWKPRWSGDYTLNGNVQSMVAASLCANHDECHEALMNYMDTLMDDFRENARALLGFRGPLIPWRTSTHGKTHYLAFKNHHHDFPGVYWFGGTAWFAQLYYDYFLYTGDSEFFEQRLKPFLFEAATLYEDFLTLEKDGRYILAPDSSPENETSDNIWMAPNPTMTIAGIKQLLRTLLRHREQLGVSEQDVERWEGMLSKLPEYAVTQSGALQEWTWPGIENVETHRHSSHLYPLWFGVDPDIAASETLQQACRIAIEDRMAPRRAENGGFMAYGYYFLGMPAAYLGDTEHAYEAVEYLANSYWSPVMMPQHNHDPDGPDVLNVDIGGGLPALVITMLVQSLMRESVNVPWVIKLLPCLPRQWPSGSLTGVRCRGGFEIDITWREGELESLSLTSLRGEAVFLVYKDIERFIEVAPGERVVLARESWRGT